MSDCFFLREWSSRDAVLANLEGLDSPSNRPGPFFSTWVSFVSAFYKLINYPAHIYVTQLDQPSQHEEDFDLDHSLSWLQARLVSDFFANAGLTIFQLKCSNVPGKIYRDNIASWFTERQSCSLNTLYLKCSPFTADDCIVSDEEIGLILNTTSANHFNFVAPDMQPGDHLVVVEATAVSSAAFTNGTYFVSDS